MITIHLELQLPPAMRLRLLVRQGKLPRRRDREPGGAAYSAPLSAL